MAAKNSANALARWQEMVPQPSVVDHLLLFGCYLRLWIVHQVTAQLKLAQQQQLGARALELHAQVM